MWPWPNQSDTESAKELVSSMAISLAKVKHRIQWLHDNDSADILSWPSLALCSPSTTHQTVTYWKDTRSTTGTTVITEYRTKTPRTPEALQSPKHHIQTLEALQALLQHTEMPTDMAKDTRSTTGTMVTKAQHKTTNIHQGQQRHYGHQGIISPNIPDIRQGFDSLALWV